MNGFRTRWENILSKLFLTASGIIYLELSNYVIAEYSVNIVTGCENDQGMVILRDMR